MANGGVLIQSSGTVSGGLSGDGNTRADAIAFAGGGNTLILQSGCSVVSDVTSFSDSAGAGDTLELGGSSDDNFDLAALSDQGPETYRGVQFVGFSALSKMAAASGR